MKRWALISLFTILLPVVIIFIKIFYLDYEIIDVLPDSGYKLTLEIETSNRKSKAIRMSTFAPVNNYKQQVYREESISDSYKFKITRDEDNRIIQWSGENLSGVNRVKYNARIKSNRVKFLFDGSTVADKKHPLSYRKYLVSTDLIQVDSDLIRKKTGELIKDKHNLYDRLRAFHNFITKKIKYVDFSGGLDAVSSLQLLEASCNGKSRLFVAMARQIGLPARVVGGIILNRSPKRVIHQWVEIYINGQWVPFCPTNRYFSWLPARYVVLYYGDHVMFRHTSKIKFDYSFSFDKTTLPKPGLSSKYRDLPINIFALMENFEKFNISLNILVYLLMLPLGAVISVILRNVLGLETFGIFLPILIASVLKGTGIVFGLGTFFGIILIVYLVNRGATELELLYHPKMAILLSMVIVCLISIFIFSIYMKNYDAINIIYFPVAIMAITVNRTMSIIEEEGAGRLLIIALNTTAVITVCYYFINSTFLQLSMLSFPELIFLLIGLNILIGRWTGLRLTEYIRFKNFFRRGDEVT